jgi:hypothetical protein
METYTQQMAVNSSTLTLNDCISICTLHLFANYTKSKQKRHKSNKKRKHLAKFTRNRKKQTVEIET